MFVFLRCISLNTHSPSYPSNKKENIYDNVDASRDQGGYQNALCFPHHVSTLMNKLLTC